ncbi:diguanylate cyclase domain-containing protein, partial [Staphylococcus aureus]|uniref:diguanylate cyclase domain-containing protein n=1 Tax=Staphylococcus aureus TaxID=1280 RepID=UPI0034D66158
MQQQLDAAIERVRRTEEHLAVVSVDLDDFRAVNDLHGHGAGDALLISLAQARDQPRRPFRQLRHCVRIVRHIDEDKLVTPQPPCERRAGGERLQP